MQILIHWSTNKSFTLWLQPPLGGGQLMWKGVPHSVYNNKALVIVNSDVFCIWLSNLIARNGVFLVRDSVAHAHTAVASNWKIAVVTEVHAGFDSCKEWEMLDWGR